MASMNTDKAYIFGLIIGGGIWGNAEEVFRIRLPYKQWGSYAQNPERASQISRDIMALVSPLFKSIYGIVVSYDTSVSGKRKTELSKTVGSEFRFRCPQNLTNLFEVSQYSIIFRDGSVIKVFGDFWMLGLNSVKFMKNDRVFPFIVRNLFHLITALSPVLASISDFTGFKSSRV